MFDTRSRRKKPLKNPRERSTLIKSPKKRTSKTKKAVKNPFFGFVVDKINGVQRKGYKYYLEVMASGSSDFECACIKATRPNNDPPKEKYITSIIAAVNNFDEVIADNILEKKLNGDKDDFDPYEIALHKIWIRIANKQDYRIKLKALYILHRLWSSVDFDSAAILRKRMTSLSKRKCKKTRTLYFSKKDAIETSSCPPDHSHFTFLEFYCKYVMYRCRTFSPSFEEAILGFQSPSSPSFSTSSSSPRGNKIKSLKSQKLVTTNGPEKLKKLSSILEKLKEGLSLIAGYSSSEETADDVTASCFSLLRKDVQQLYVLYEERLADLVQEYTISSLSSEKKKTKKEKITSPEITEIVENPVKLDKQSREHIGLCNFYIEITEKLRHWISHNSKIYRNFDYDASEMNMETCLSLSKVRDHVTFVKYKH